MRDLVVVTADWHVNSTIGLCPARVALDDGGVYMPSPAQQWIRERWGEFWRAAVRRWEAIPPGRRGRRVVIVNGDLVESFHHGTTQIVSANDSIQHDMALEVGRGPRSWADVFLVVRGTEAHGGGCGYKEELLACDLGATPCPAGTWSWWQLQAEFGGVRLIAAHHPGTRDGRAYTLGGACNRLAAGLIVDFAGEALPDLGLFSHNHVAQDSGQNYPIRVVITPAWMLKSALVHRMGRGFGLATIGGVMFECEGGRIHDLEVVRYQAQREGYWQP